MTIRPFLATMLTAALLAACGAPDQTQSDASNVPTPTAETPPNTDIYLMDMALTDEGTPALTILRPAITGPGYDNQPSFIPGAASFYYAASGESGKTDIWRYDLATGDTAQITDTPTESEYSPRQAPDGRSIAYIQESPDGSMTTLNVRDPEGTARRIVELAPLGYYAFFDSGLQAAVFYRSEPPELHLIDIVRSLNTRHAQSIGRGLYASPDGSGVHYTTTSGEAVLLNRYDTATTTSTLLFPLPPGAQDYAIFALPDGSTAFLAGSETTLYFHPGATTEDWVEVADLGDAEVGQITRLAVSEDLGTLAVVVGE